MKWSVWLVLVLFWSLPVMGQRGAERYQCAFLQPGNDPLELEFVWEQGRGRGVVIGNNGFSDVLVWQGREIISFVEMVGTGAIQSTSVAPDGTALHSRHTYSSGRFINQQSLGLCTRP